MGLCDKAGFPISSSWTGKPSSSWLAKLGMLSPDSPTVHYLDVWHTNPNTFHSPRCRISNAYEIDGLLANRDLCVKLEAWGQLEGWPCGYCLCSTFSTLAGFTFSSVEGRSCHTNRIFCKLFIWLYKVHLCQYGIKSLDLSRRYRDIENAHLVNLVSCVCMCMHVHIWAPASP